MSLTPILFLSLFSVGCIAAIFNSPKYGLYTYFVAFFMAPKHTWYEDAVPDVRYLLIAGVIALVSLAIHGGTKDRTKWMDFGGVKIFTYFTVLVWIIYIWCVDPEEHLQGCVLYTKHLLITYLVYRVCSDIKMLKQVALVIVIGGFWFGWLVFGKSGRVEGVAGAISGANSLGMTGAVGVICAGMMVLGFTGRYRLIPFLCTPIILNSVVLAGSRGAFLGLLSGGIAAAYLCPKVYRGKFAIMSVLAVVLFVSLAHDQFLTRLASLLIPIEGERSLDNSATSRFEIARYGWEMAKDHPLGAGHKGTRTLSAAYMPAHLMSEGARSAHNSIMDALVSYGFVGAGLYLMLYGWFFVTLLRLRSLSEKIRDPDVGTLCTMYGGMLGAVFVCGFFSNFVFAEIQYWILGMIAATLNLPQVRNAAVGENTRQVDETAPTDVTSSA